MVLFPFMSKGHTIPLLHLAHLLHRRNISVTFFTTTANRLFISDSLSDTDASIVELPFPQDIEGVPAGVENTEKLPSMSLFVPFANATKLMQPNFEEALETLPQITSIISDGFLWWTQQSATKFGIPRLVTYGFSNYSKAVRSDVMTNGLLSGPELDDVPFALTNFPRIKLTRNDFDEPLHSREPKGPYMDFVTEVVIATSKSYALESICAKVPILAWPMMAEQHVNARMVVEEIKVGLRVETINGSVRGFVKSEGLEKMVRELMEGEMGKEARKKVEGFGEMAKKAVEEGGSSWQTLNQLINELQALRNDCWILGTQIMEEVGKPACLCSWRNVKCSLAGFVAVL
ncbi:hypothetical protein RHSIM_Rhsim08G0056400 [Rhododendron simsii]|uniref:Uncharacterized protein n=1 Tax=Rhododendron simsii TaxID=118357 RepID=A0A834GJD6_RHOSS|nr:hypothetical protein RHSIM_Rhsim08G0056400 [Rhododendron simsii]